MLHTQFQSSQTRYTSGTEDASLRLLLIMAAYVTQNHMPIWDHKLHIAANSRTCHLTNTQMAHYPKCTLYGFLFFSQFIVSILYWKPEVFSACSHTARGQAGRMGHSRYFSRHLLTMGDCLLLVISIVVPDRSVAAWYFAQKIGILGCKR